MNIGLLGMRVEDGVVERRVMDVLNAFRGKLADTPIDFVSGCDILIALGPSLSKWHRTRWARSLATP
jgi:hypothetical protein